MTASFIIAHTYSPGAATSQVVSFAGAGAGDLALIFAVDGADTPSGWSVVTSLTGNLITTTVLSKVLSAPDIATGAVTVTGLNASGGGAATAGIVIYRGATQAVSVSTIAQGGVGSMTIPGYSKTARCRGVVTYGATITGSAPAAPAGPTSRVSVGNLGLGVADYLPAAAYPSGSDVVWGSSQARSSAALIELR